MKYIWFSESLSREMVAHVRAEAPKEACGILAGKNGQVMRVIPAANVASDPLHYYEMEAAALSRHLPGLEREGLELLGFYHSHPTGDPIPSPSDVAKATYPGTAYVIVGLKYGEARLAAWLIERRNVQRLNLHVGLYPPEPDADEPLSPAQRFAVLGAALLAFLILIVLSLMLLPPAPIIPN